jgi:hypothetical protein
VHPHHQKAVALATERFRADPEARALLLTGSLAHGFASETSDVDLAVVVSDAEFEARLAEGRLQYWSAEGCEWPGGYVEGKYVGPAFLARVAERGSEPARFAFQDARILFSRIDGLEELLRAIVRYPAQGRAERIRRFHAQFEAWHWYAHEALKRDDRYLLWLSVAKMVLFGGRMILALNERLHPYHKWFLKVLADVPERPADLLERIAAVHDDPCQATLLGLWATVRNFRSWEGSEGAWATQFMLDSELKWLDGEPPVDDL